MWNLLQACIHEYIHTLAHPTTSHAQAEQVVSIVGIKNAQAGYFGGQTERMGAA